MWATSFSNNIFENTINQCELFFNIEKTKVKEILADLKNNFEKLDKEIRVSYERKKAGWKIKDLRERTIITIYGDVRFDRTRYFRKNSANKIEYKCLFDDHIQLKKYERLANDLKVKILNQLGDGKSYKNILETMPHANISEQTISNVIKKFNIDKFELEDYFVPKIDASKYKYLYIETDDTFPHLKVKNKKKAITTRLFVFHLGVENLSYKNGKVDWQGSTNIRIRNRLIHKRVYFKFDPAKFSRGEFAQKIRQKINAWYKNTDHLEYVMLGDGASWIEKLAEEIDAHYVLDKFHLLKEIKRLFSYGGIKERWSLLSKIKWSYFNKIRYLILSGKSDYYKLLEEFNDIWVDAENYGFFEEEWFDAFRKLIKYVKKHKIGISNYFKEFNSQSHTEGMISCFVKRVLGYGKKIYNKNNFSNLLTINALKTNGYDFKNLLEMVQFNKDISVMSENYNSIGFDTKLDLDRWINKLPVLPHIRPINKPYKTVNYDFDEEY